MDEKIELDSKAPGEIKYYKLPDGRKVTIGKYVVDFFERLQELPAFTKIQMMNLSAEEMTKYINDHKKTENKLLIELLQRKWYWRETGEEILVNEVINEDISFSLQTMLFKSKSKRPYTLEQIKKLIDFFTGENKEVYNK